MGIAIGVYKENDVSQMVEVWNEAVAGGDAFPQRELLNEKSAMAFFAGQSYTIVAREDGKIVGLAIIHPNNVGRCAHIANASYAVRAGERGRHIGEQLVRASLEYARKAGFRILQFNAVVATNAPAIHLYERMGFTRVGKVPGGFCRDGGVYEDIFIYYIEL